MPLTQTVAPTVVAAPTTVVAAPTVEYASTVEYANPSTAPVQVTETKTYEVPITTLTC